MNPSIAIRLKARGVKIPYYVPDGTIRDRARQASDTLHGLLKDVGLHEDSWQKEIEDHWTVLVGKTIAEHCRPGEVHHGVLNVYADHSIWVQQLSRYSSKEILLKLQDTFGKSRIRRLHVKLDPEAFRQ